MAKLMGKPAAKESAKVNPVNAVTGLNAANHEALLAAPENSQQSAKNVPVAATLAIKVLFFIPPLY